MAAGPFVLVRTIVSLARTVDVLLGAGGIQNARDAVAEATLNRSARAALDGSPVEPTDLRAEFTDVNEEVQIPETLAH